MKAVVLLCLLHVAFIETQNDYEWPMPDDIGPPDVVEKYGCENNQAACGCCLISKQMHYAKKAFDYCMLKLRSYLSMSQMALKNHTRGKRSAFSVTLHNTASLDCYGPFDNNEILPFDHVLINMEDSYSTSTGVFTVPCSGVYSLSLTLFGYRSPQNLMPTCAELQVNGDMVSSLPRTNVHSDKEDSSSKVMGIKLMAGDQVTVVLPAGCIACDNARHMTVFTGFLLYATDE